MGDPDKKAMKAAAKAQKKLAKTQQKQSKSQPPPAPHSGARPTPSAPVRFAESVRGILYLIFAVSLTLAVILSKKGYAVTTNDLIDNLISHLAGKVVLLVIAVAFFIYGLKRLRALK